MKKIIQSLTITALLLMTPLISGAQGLGSVATKAMNEAEIESLFPTRAMLESGKAVAESSCADCHGMDGVSDAAGKPHLAGQRTVYIYRVLQAFQSGRRPDELKLHNKFLNDEALLSAAMYYSSLTPAPLPEVIEEPEVVEGETSVEVGSVTGVVVDEEDIFERIRPAMTKCIKCHNVSGNSDSKGMPSLSAQHPEYFVSSMRGYIDGSRSHKLMKKLVGKLDEADLKEMGVYYAVQKPVKTSIAGEGDVNVGRRLSKDCESCHGENGNAKKNKMPTLAGQDAKFFIKAMDHYKSGKRKHEKMFDAVEALSDQDVIDLAAFYAAEEPRKRNNVRAPLKSTEWIARCERCHGIDGNSNDPRFAMLAGQQEAYLAYALKAYASGVRQNSIMHAMADPLTAKDVERISAYFAAQQPKSVIYIQLPDREGKIK